MSKFTKSMRLLIVDNYDSFTFNLKHMCEPYVSSVDVLRNDDIDINRINKYDKIIISPGPGLPQDAGISIEVIKKYFDKKDILGVCLGAQAIALAFGCELFNLKKVMHGKTSTIRILDKKNIIYRGLPKNITIGRYHSWAVDLSTEENLIVTSVDEDNVVMSFRHKKHPVIGIQYHPESILTRYGQQILKNWLID